MKKFLIIVLIILITSKLFAQDRKEPKVKTIPLPDSTFIDSLDIAYSEAEKDTTLQIMPLEEIEDYIISLQDTFFNYGYKSFELEEYYTFGNAHYILPDNRREFCLKNVKLNSVALPQWQLYSLLNYYNSNVRADWIELKPLQNSFRALLTDVQYSNGDYNNEKKYIGFIKNDFLKLADLQLFAHSGEHNSPWGKKCYYDDFVFNIQKKFFTQNYSAHSVSWTFIKLFSALETYNVLNPDYSSDPEKQYFQKNENISNIAGATFFDRIISLSLLHQYNKEQIIGGTRNILNRFQVDLGFDLPLEEYATKVLFRADVQDIHHALYNGWLHDYIIRLELNSPGIFGDFYTLKVINNVIFSEKPDSIFVMPELIFDVPITESINSELSIGARRKEKNFYNDGVYALDNKTKVIFTEGTLDITTKNLTLELCSMHEEIRNDGQWQWISENPEYKEFEDYIIYGAKLDGIINYSLLSIDSQIRLKGSYFLRPDSLLNYPSYRAKIQWTNRLHMPHRNFIYANASASYLGNFLDIKGNKIDHQLFCSAEVGVSIKRFLLYLKFTNLFNILDSNYFMYNLNEVDPFGVSFGVQWNFIN